MLLDQFLQVLSGQRPTSKYGKIFIWHFIECAKGASEFNVLRDSTSLD
jgi:hypothetical protein